MRGLFGVLLLAVGAFVIYLYVKQTGGAPAGTNVNVDPNAITGKAKGAWDEFYAQPWFWTLAVAATLATLGVMTWRRIGGWGRGFVLVCVTIAAVILVTR
jgi:hypothetical protein